MQVRLGAGAVDLHLQQLAGVAGLAGLVVDQPQRAVAEQVDAIGGAAQPDRPGAGAERVLAVELHLQLARHQRLRLRRLEAEGALAEARGDGGAEQHGPLDRPLRRRNGLQQAIDHRREQRPRLRQRRGVDRAVPRRGPLVEERLEHRVDERAARPRRQPRLLDDVFLEAEHVAREVLERAGAVAIERGHRVGDRRTRPDVRRPGRRGRQRPAGRTAGVRRAVDRQRARRPARTAPRRPPACDGRGRQRQRRRGPRDRPTGGRSRRPRA